MSHGVSDISVLYGLSQSNSLEPLHLDTILPSCVLSLHLDTILAVVGNAVGQRMGLYAYVQRMGAAWLQHAC